MNKQNIFILAVISLAYLLASCEKNWNTIDGRGAIVTEILDIDDFSKVSIQGVDDVHIQYGSEQKVEVRGHANIIRRIERFVSNGKWFIELENGNYGQYELSYYLTVPLIESVTNSGTGNIYIDGSMSVNNFNVYLSGTGSFYGFTLETLNCVASITGTGAVEISVSDNLDVDIEGTGSVYYKGYPAINSSIRGAGRVVNSN